MEKTLDKNLTKERLNKFLSEKRPMAQTISDLYAHSVKDGEGEEVDEFIKLREEWRKKAAAKVTIEGSRDHHDSFR